MIEEKKVDYKHTDVGIIPKDWDVKSLGDISRVTMGQSPLSKFYNNEKVGVPLVQGNADIKKRKTIIRHYSSQTTKLGKKGEIILTVRAPVGAVAKATFDCCLGRGVCSISFPNDYLFYYLQQLEESWGRHTSGSTFDSINSSQLKKILIAVPNLIEEQKKIAAALTDIDGLINSLEELIVKKRNMKKAAIQKLFIEKKGIQYSNKNWEELTLGDVCSEINDGTHYTPKYVTEGIPFYSVENVTSNDFENVKYITLEEHRSLIKRCFPRKGDILLTRIGSIGQTRLIDWDVDASIYVSLALLKTNQKIEPSYLYEYTKSNFFIKDIESRSLINATPKKINMGDIKNVVIRCPKSKKEQLEIAKILSDMRQEIHKLELHLAKARSLKIGMMQELLTGKTRLNKTNNLGGVPL